MKTVAGESPMKLAHPRPVRLYESDDQALRDLHKEVGEKYGIDIVQFIRDCVHIGRPLLEKKYKQ